MYSCHNEAANSFATVPNVFRANLNHLWKQMTLVCTCIVIGLTQKLKGKENQQPVNQETLDQEPNVHIIPYLDILQY